MEKTDARKHTQEVQQELRKQAVRLRKQKRKYREISEITGVHIDTVCRWCKSYERGGSKALQQKRRGRKEGEQRKLTSSQEKEIQKEIKDKAPDQLKLSFALWTRQAVSELIRKLYGIEMPIRTTGDYLGRWGFTPQKPLKRAYEQNPVKVKKWLDEEYPEIKKKAKQEGAEIHWGDETGLANNSQHGRSYAPRGKTPAIRLPAKKHRINIISTVTNQGKVRFMVYDNTMDARTMIKFMKRLIKDAGRKVYLILDNLRVHHSKTVKEWVEQHKDQIELFYLPSYSPELNPDEYLNCDLKAGVHSKVPAITKSELKEKAISHLRMLQKKPNRVAKYFEHHKIAYAA